ncbi:MAG: maleylpyruvate isomerase N-terminal domain-containing protein [Blastococcus sp.]
MRFGHAQMIEILERELDAVSGVLDDVSDDDWKTSTHLAPEGEGTPPWRVADLVAHIDISIGLTLGLLDTVQEGQPGRDRASFFIACRTEVAPIVYQYAGARAAAHDRESLMEDVRKTCTASLQGIRNHDPDVVGSGYFALMRLEEWVPTRVVEAVVHGIDLTDALGRAPVATADGIAVTAEILDDVLARRTVAGRPAGMTDDLDWVRAASGRMPHTDPRLPLIV